MFLPSVFSKKAKDRYIGLFLKNEEVIGFVFEPTSTGMLTIAQDRRPFSNGWENVVEDIDDLLIKLEGETKNKARQAIFFVYSYFIDEPTGEIKAPYKEVVKNILKHLDLKALGYIECFEAVSSFIERRDSRPLNAVLVELDNTHVDVCIYKAGKRIFTKCTSRTDNVLDDVSNILSEIKGEVLPSRVVIYDSDNIHSNAGNLLEHKWETDLFVQLPRIEIIQEEQLHQELSTIFGQQLLQTGASVAEEKTYEPVPPKMEEKKEVAVATKEEKPPQVMGFAIDSEVTESEYENSDDANSVAADSFGPTSMKKRNFKFSLPTFSGFMPKKNVAFRYAWVIGLLLIAVSLFLVEYYLHTATLTVFLPSQAITKQLKEKIDLANETGNGIDIKQSTYSATFEQSKSTSGEREVGEKARGEVTIYNLDSKERLFAKGTVLDAEGKKFVLDQDVPVKAATAEGLLNPTIKVGTAKAAVVANVLGPESNLTKGKKFKVGDLSTDDAYAVNESAFSGGTKKEMQTVSKKDIEDLKTQVLAKAKEESITAISKNANANEKILNSLTEVKLGDFTLSKELGEEAKDVTIQAKVNTSYYFYDAAEIKNYISDTIKSDVPDKYHLVASKVDYNMSDVKKDGDVLGVQIDIHALSVKDAQQEELLKKVKGKPKNELKSILEQEVNATGYTIDVKSPIPLLDNLMPLFQKNIHLETTASQ